MMRQKIHTASLSLLYVKSCTVHGLEEDSRRAPPIQYSTVLITVHCTLYIIQAQDSSGSVPSDTG